MLRHVLIGWGFITSLLDDIHVILGHIPYSSRSTGICLFMHAVLIKMMILVMTSMGFHHVSIGFHTRAYPIVIGTIRRSLVCANSFH